VIAIDYNRSGMIFRTPQLFGKFPEVGGLTTLLELMCVAADGKKKTGTAPPCLSFVIDGKRV
jgi:hypothetical protein